MSLRSFVHSCCSVAVICPVAVATAQIVVRPMTGLATIPPSNSANTLTLGLDTDFTTADSDQSTVTGNLAGNIQVEVVGTKIRPIGFNFTSGTFSATDVSFSNTTFLGSVESQSNGLGGSIRTLRAISSVSGAGFIGDGVTSTSGTFSGGDHEITVNQGTIDVDAQGSAEVFVDDQSISFVTSPFSLTAEGITGTLLVTELSASSSVGNYRSRISIPIDVEQMPDGLPATITATGTLVVEGLFSVSFPEPTQPGDYNGDGIVDGADYTVWRDTLGQTGSDLAADGSGDNSVGQEDYDIWRTNFGEQLASLSQSGTPVPEPAAIGLALIGLAGLLAALRRRAKAS